ncbi:clostripain [Aquimarina sp. MAR_2010_214]|uniref:clostripain-related cysteine peptidase n=1 Tax=Aquimarina sp. MAR_2010_214 TaxID=1250026 RepID=UPI000C712B48|nr:clostripain-related cysteine peptidase [Aquimarina sp. MAR_2010_214]PKV51147.1 clostripain [Aquimarina sp. MAR_2010_214]
MKNKVNISLIILFIVSVATTTIHSQTDTGWTIMYYGAGSNSSELDLLKDIKGMIKGKQSKGYELITLIDRIEGFSNNSKTLGENFTDTKLYRIDANSYHELSGKEILPEFKKETSYEANMGDADLLKRFIKYCKTYYPAKHYMLVLRSHGNGWRMCPDKEAGIDDALHSTELSDVLSIDESVDILGLDLCSMAGLENFYEWRPNETSFSADYILASAPVSSSWDYKSIFSRLSADTKNGFSKQNNYFEEGKEKILDPFKMTPDQFSKLLIEEIYDSQKWSSWGLFDNTKITDVKLKIDELARLLSVEKNATIYSILERSSGYYNEKGIKKEKQEVAFPYVDAYDFAQKISNTQELHQKTRIKAKEVCKIIDQLVIHSYYGGKDPLPKKSGFMEGKNGVYMIAPRGNQVYTPTGKTFWEHVKKWYSPYDQKHIAKAYGLYNWCIDGMKPKNEKADNFYEYLDFLFTK